MKNTSHDAILAIRDREVGRLRAMSEPGISRAPSPGKWCAKEVLGHLIDSAGNNAQRFVRAQLSTELAFPGYEQEKWVAVQDYAHEDWKGLVELWSALNAHLAHVVSRIPAAGMATPCRIGDKEPVSLGAVIESYITHIEHHLAQL
jgi:hypothetical protein